MTQKSARNPSQATVILLAEDEPGIRKLVKVMLESAGYQVLMAGDGAAALAISEAYREPIHLLLTDIEMPHLNGYALRAAVRQQRPAIRVVMMSGSDDEATESTFIKKPFNFPALLRTIEGALQEA